MWVAAGVYRPTDRGDRTATIRLHTGVGLYGGFTGMETERDQRDWKSNETILSGAISDDPKDHSYHVVIGADDAVIDGFTIRDGYNLPEGRPPASHEPRPAARITWSGHRCGDPQLPMRSDGA